jgi:hypothetical protein
MRQFRRDSVVHWGFQPLTSSNQIQNDDLVVIVWFDGEPEMYVADNRGAVHDIKRMYTEEWGDRDMPIIVLTPTEYWGSKK